MIMNSIDINVITTVVVILAVIVIVIMNIYKFIKNNKKDDVPVTESISTFIELNSNSIIKCLQNAIIMVKCNQTKTFDNKDEYEKEVIKSAIITLRVNCKELGISESLIDSFNIDKFTELLHNIYKNNSILITSNIDPTIITKNPGLFDSDVVANAIDRITNNYSSK